MRKVCKKHNIEVSYLFMRNSGNKIYICKLCPALIQDKDIKEIK